MRPTPPVLLPTVAGLVLAAGATLAGCSGRSDAHPTATTEKTPMTAPHDAPANEESGASTSRYHVVRMVYAAGTQVLHVRLASGIYRFTGVPKATVDAFAAADDRDAFFRQRIDDRFSATHITPGMPADYAAATRALGEDAGGAPAR